jgi:hypothetical protein
MGQTYKGEIGFIKVPIPAAHYQDEYRFDTTLNTQVWKNLSKGMHVSFASTDELYFRSEVPELKTESLSWNVTGWKGERLNAVVLVWSPDTLQQVRFALSDLTNKKGKVLNKNYLQVNVVKYVIGNYPYGAKDVTCDASPYKNLYLMPDRFEEFDRFDLPGNTTRPVWISLNIPQGAEDGEYHGNIEVKSAGYDTTLNVTITVQNHVLPKPYEWKHRLDLWQNPWVVAWQNQLKPWSQQHKMLLKKHLEVYAMQVENISQLMRFIRPGQIILT